MYTNFTADTWGVLRPNNNIQGIHTIILNIYIYKMFSAKMCSPEVWYQNHTHTPFCSLALSRVPIPGVHICKQRLRNLSDAQKGADEWQPFLSMSKRLSHHAGVLHEMEGILISVHTGSGSTSKSYLPAKGWIAKGFVYLISIDVFPKVFSDSVWYDWFCHEKQRWIKNDMRIATLLTI